METALWGCLTRPLQDSGDTADGPHSDPPVQPGGAGVRQRGAGGERPPRPRHPGPAAGVPRHRDRARPPQCIPSLCWGDALEIYCTAKI